MTSSPIPVSLITGFLGAGKTTLLNRLLASGELKDTALIINEFGDVGIDHLLIETADEGVIELSDGCLCCTIRSDLVDTLFRLLKRKPQPDRIVIESTGLADPAPILHALMGHPTLSDQLRLDGVITVIDSVNGAHTLDTQEEAVKQAAMADRLVITKSELKQANETLLDRLTMLNPTARIVLETDKPGFGDLFECGLYNPETKTADVARWLNDEVLRHRHDHHHNVNRHDARIRAFTLSSNKAVSASTLATFIDLLRSAHGPNLLRVKGIVQIQEDPDRPVVIHGVQQIFHPPATLASWPGGERKTRLVMITKDLSSDFVSRLFSAFTGEVGVDSADKQALENNPLSVPGLKL